MSAAVSRTEPFKLRNLLRSLRHANFRRYFIGQGVSLMGTWMQQTALAWLVYRLTGDAFLMGLNTFASQIPSLLLLPVAGTVVDHWNRLSLVRVTQTLSMLQALILAALVFLDVVELWQVMLLAFGLGCVNAFDLPARQALLPELLESREDLSNAIALNSSLFNGARLVGPAIAGVLVGLGSEGEGWCFLLNGLSYVAVLIGLAYVTTVPVFRPPPASMWQVMTEGFRFVWADPAIRRVLLLVATIGFLGMPYTVLMPLFARDVLHGGPESYGLLLTASGMGALAGAIYMAGRSTLRGTTVRIAVTSVLAGLSFAGFAVSRSFPLSFVLILVGGMNMMLTIVSCNTVIQTIVPDEKRGRVMSLYTLAFMGLTPFGSLIVGGVTQCCDPAIGMLVCAGGCLLGAAVFASAVPTIRATLRAHVARLAEKPAPMLPATATAGAPPEQPVTSAVTARHTHA